MYGDALVTVSEESSTEEPRGFGSALAGGTGSSYVNSVTPSALVSNTWFTRYVPLYLVSLTLLMITLVSTFRPKIPAESFTLT